MDEFIIRWTGQIVTRILVAGASGFAGRALVSLDRGDRHRRTLCDLDLGQGVSV
jgi:nucleoside-diphosphate-sugar epimerase